MQRITTFKAYLFNAKKIKDLSKVICPPYDVISTQAQGHYYRLHKYNIIRLVLGKEYSTDTKNDNRYTKARRLFKDWQKTKILIQDESPNLYFYSQTFYYKGEKKERRGLIGLMRLDEKESLIFPHEYTRPAPKEDRLKLLKQVKANLSPIFCLFCDTQRIINRIFDNYLLNKRPFLKMGDDEEVTHRLWRLCDEEIIKKINTQIEDKPIFIADGHHRYEVALAYHKFMQKRGIKTQAFFKEGYNHVLTYLSDSESKGLLILPLNRLIKRFPLRAETFLKKIEDLFRIEELKDRVKFLFLLKKGGIYEHMIGAYFGKDRYYLLRLKNERVLDEFISKDYSKEYKRLDVFILHEFIFSRNLNVKEEEIDYISDQEEAIRIIDAQEAKVAFLLNPISIAQLKRIALNNERMPQKSTYFYPKIPSGLLIHKFNKDIPT